MYQKFVSLCEKNNESVYKVCKEVGIKPSTISNVKNDPEHKRQFSFDTLEKICNHFGVSMDYFRS